MKRTHLSLYDQQLLVPIEEIEILLHGYQAIPWADFLMNPRRLRGSDFLMRWSQGEWSEKRLTQAVNETGEFYALPYGPSGVAPADPKAFEIYFERLDKAGLAGVKRPDLLIFPEKVRALVTTVVNKLGGMEELPFISDDDSSMRQLLELAILAVECENSLWKSRQMPDYGRELTQQKRLGGQLGLKKSAVLPTIIIKQEDRSGLLKWQAEHGLSIHVWHVFYDAAYAISLDKAEDLIATGQIAATEQTFQAPSGPTTKKIIYKIYYQHAYPLAVAVEEPKLIADSICDVNGHILPYVKFEGGRLKLLPEAQLVLREL